MATKRVATCRCGQLRAICLGEPMRVSVCHCLECQKRTGSTFSVQARWPEDRVELTGEAARWSRTGDSGSRSTYAFCPTCGSTVAYASENIPGLTAVPVGAFADPGFPPPRYSVHEERKHDWVAVLGETVDHQH